MVTRCPPTLMNFNFLFFSVYLMHFTCGMLPQSLLLRGYFYLSKLSSDFHYSISSVGTANDKNLNTFEFKAAPTNLYIFFKQWIKWQCAMWNVPVVMNQIALLPNSAIYLSSMEQFSLFHLIVLVFWPTDFAIHLVSSLVTYPATNSRQTLY